MPEPPLWGYDGPCTDYDFKDVIRPLYTRGWCVIYNNMALEVDGKCAIGKRPVLNGVFRFMSFDAALRFSRDVLDLARAEKVSIMIVEITMMTRYQITVSLWLEARIVVVQGVSQVKENRVMRRDARVEQLFVEKHARQSQLHGMKLFAQPLTVEKVSTQPTARIMPSMGADHEATTVVIELATW